MKKISVFCFSLLALCLLMASCDPTDTPRDTIDSGASDTAQTAPIVTESALPEDTRTASEIASEVVAHCTFSEELIPNKSYLSHHLFDFAALSDSYTDSAAVIPMGITPEEVLVFIAKDEADAKALCNKLNAYIDYQTSEYGDYKPSEVPKLDGAVVASKGKFVVYVVSTDNVAAADAVAEILE